MFHMLISIDMREACGKLKYLRYNASKICTWHLNDAFAIAQYQFVISLLCEFSFMFTLSRQEDAVDALICFMAFTGISKMDRLYIRTVHFLEIKHYFLEKEGILQLEDPIQYGFLKFQKETDKAIKCTFKEPLP